jgi:hypothetical protein
MLGFAWRNLANWVALLAARASRMDWACVEMLKRTTAKTVEGYMIVDVLKTAERRQTQKLNSTNVILDDLIDGCNDFQRVARKARDNDERALQQEKKIWGLPRMCICEVNANIAYSGQYSLADND